MAYTLAQAPAVVSGSGSNTISKAFSSTVTAHSVLVAFLTTDAATPGTVAFTGGGTWQQVNQKLEPSGSGQWVVIGCCLDATGGTAPTIQATWTGSGSFNALMIGEFTNGGVASLLDASTLGSSGNTAAPTDTAMTAADVDLAVSYNLCNGGAAATAGSGFVIGATDSPDVASWEYDLTAGPGSVTCLFSLGGSQPWVIVSALFKSAAAAAPAGGPWFTSPLAELPFSFGQAPWEQRQLEPPIPMAVWTTPDVLGGDQSIGLSDTAAADDSLTITTAVPTADTATGSDSLTVAAAAALADTASAADALTVTVASPLADTATATDALTITVALPLADTATAVDAVTAGVPIALADTATAADALTAVATLPLADTATAVDALAVLSDAVDPAAWFLSPFAELPFAAPAPWEGGLNKGVIVLEVWTSPPSISGDANISLADTATAADALTATVTLPLTDTATAADALTITVTLPLADTATATDGLTAGVPITLSDTATTADALTITVATPLTDTAAAADTATITAAVPLTDTGTGTDALNVAGSGSPALTDTATATDSLTITAVTLPLADTATATEALFAGVPIALADTAAAADALTRTIAVTLTDTAAAADALTIAVAAPLAETAVALDSVLASVAFTLPDAATATDVLTQQAVVLFQGSITGGTGIGPGMTGATGSGGATGGTGSGGTITGGVR